MIGFGFAEVLIFVMMGGGTGATDLATLVQPAHYFQSRQIDVSIDKMMELAAREPKDPKTQIQQLLALRYLADEVEALKKSPKFRDHEQTLQKIVQGKQSADALGFAADYADLVTRKLGYPRPQGPAYRPLREDALAWFPADVTFGVGLDMRQPNLAAENPVKEFLKTMPEHEKKAMYDFLEKAGNVRVERFALGFVEGKKPEEQRYFLRASGKVNQAWLVDAIKPNLPPALDFKQLKADDGTPITTVHMGKGEPAFVAIGNTDLVMVLTDRSNPMQADMIAQVLEIRAKKKPGAVEGVLKERLKKIPDKAIAFVVGDVPEKLNRGFGFIVDPVPANITGFIERVPMGLDVHVETSMANGDDADKVVQKVGALRKEGIQELKNAMQRPLPPDFPQIPFQSLIGVMESLQVQSQKEKVQVRAFVPERLIQQIAQMGMHVAGRSEPKPPLKK